MLFLQVWSQYRPSLTRLAYQAWGRSAQKSAFDHEDFLQEAAICVIKCLDRYGETCSRALIYKVVKNRFGTILHAQYLQARVLTTYEPSEPFSLAPYLTLSQKLSPLAQQILWILVDPPDSIWEQVALQKTATISRQIVADYLGVAPQRVSEAIKELKEALRYEKALCEEVT